jgi:hypothetical protein
MLANYYDKSKADEFTDTFGQLYIGNNPTPYCSTLLVLLFDFSGISTYSQVAMESEFHREINGALSLFLHNNSRFLGKPDLQHLINEDDSSSLLVRVLVSAHP